MDNEKNSTAKNGNIKTGNEGILEQDKVIFWDLSELKVTAKIEDRAKHSYIKSELEKRFPGEIFESVEVSINRSGKYQARAGILERFFGAGEPIEGLPDYIEVKLSHTTGTVKEHLIVWSPFAWNDRFAGTAGGGTKTGGEDYLTRPKNTQRGWTLPFALMNGFTAATMDAGNISGFKDRMLDPSTGVLSRDYYENWRHRSTHNMTVIGKATAEILHNRKVAYSYMNGGSGGGRQCLMEVQKYPEDYDGVWASCPAINWHKFLMGGFWPVVVMNQKHHFLTAKKNKFFLQKVQEYAGGKDAYYTKAQPVSFDAGRCVGMRSPGGIISEEDAEVMNEIWRGPHRKNGDRLWYGFYPGVQNWQKVIPIGTYYYPLFGFHRVQEFILGTYHGRWITGNPKETFRHITLEEFEQLYDDGLRKFTDSLGDDPAIDDFVSRGGKLMIDHGMDDPLIPTEGTIDYYRKLIEHFGTQERLDDFCRLYITPGDNHGNCWGNGPGITERAGLEALVKWTEYGIAPEEIETVQVDRKTGGTIQRRVQNAWRGW